MKKSITVWLLLLAAAITLSSCRFLLKPFKPFFRLPGTAETDDTGSAPSTEPAFETTDLGFEPAIIGADGTVLNPGKIATPLLFHVSDGNGRTLWLFGSIHVTRKDMGELPDYVRSAFRSSDALAVEANVVEVEKDMSRMVTCLQSMVYRDGSSIKDHIPKELYQEAKHILKQNKSYSFAMDLYYPCLWADTIEMLIVSRLGFDTESGIDRQLILEATETGKDILEVESVEFQYEMMANFTPEIQTMLLESSVAAYGDPAYNTSFEELARTWCSGDREALAELLKEEDSGEDLTPEEQAMIEAYNRAILLDRNVGMAARAESYLKSGKTVFFCVGAAHIVGENGVAEALEKAGYTVEVFRG